MSKEYEQAKDVALGKVLPTIHDAGDVEWDVKPKPLSMSSELPEQMFKREFFPPGEMVAHRAALSLYDGEYDADVNASARTLASLTEMLNRQDAHAVTRLLRRQPTADWFSYVFVAEKDIDPTFVAAVRGTSDVCRRALRAALQGSLSELVTYRRLHEQLLDVIKGVKL